MNRSDESLENRLQAFLERYLRFFETGDEDERVALRTLSWESPEELGPELEAWALAAVKQLAAVSGPRLPLALRLPVFLVLARAGVEAEAEWDRLLPLGADEVEVMLALECLEAIPEERQEAALVAAVEGLSFAGDIVRAGLRLLEEHPSLPLLELVLSRAEAAARAPKRKRTTLEEFEDHLESLAEEHPELAEHIARRNEDAPEPLLLEIFTTKVPTTVAELSKIEQAQLAAAERGANDGSEPSLLGRVRLLKLADAEGSPAYDAWCTGGENGIVFEAGTTRKIAGLAQGTVSCEDPRLAAALREVLRET